ncbi:hypothetical protein AmaxDRAFT_3220 [Limnospira maxima CS-328]|uniref:Uncharacterized protein n=1 Tax=Limnospira maxima CS-328 TaxID=513049 RepID=B5W376_LIMMA|nr:hypothetical protein AmaxDRAFT_3220 [Limnospira maxima CS-328]
MSGTVTMIVVAVVEAVLCPEEYAGDAKYHG